MDFSSLQNWALSLIGGGGIGAAITYIGTYKSKRQLEKELAKQAEITTENQHGVMERDRFESMYEQLTKMAKDYSELSDQFREYRKTARAIEDQFDEKLRTKTSEIAYMKDEINYLKRLRCYDLECPKRIKTNTENQE